MSTSAQAALVSACTGASLPASRLTPVLTPLVNGIFTPLTAVPVVGPGLLVGVDGIVTNAVTGQTISLDVLDRNTGTAIDPNEACATTSDSFQLDTPAGIAIGGNAITGLGSGVAASAGTLGSIAFGNGASTTPAATDSVAVGSNASADVANSVSLGASSTATRGALASYVVPGLATLQASVGEVSVGAPGAERQITNVAAGSAPTDATNVAQVTAAIGTSAAAAVVQYSDPGTPTVANGAVPTNDATLAGGAPGAVALHNVAPAVLNAGSTDAVDGGQLFATNQNVAMNTTDITNLQNGAAGLVQQTGGAPGDGDLAVGGKTGGTAISVTGTGGDRIVTGVGAGLAANDAATVGQLGLVVGGAFNAVQYDTDALGGRLNSVTLAGGVGGPVAVSNVAPGALTGNSTDAVNGSQLAATNTVVTEIVAGNAGAFRSNNAAGAATSSATGPNASSGGFGANASGARSLALGNASVSSGTNSVALGAGSTDGGAANVVSVGSVGAERRLTNVGPGINGTDAVNLAQLQAQSSTFAATTSGLQSQINGLDFDLSRTKRRANAGTAGAMAVAGLPQPFSEGAGMVSGAMGYWQGQVAFALGVSKIVSDKAIVKAGAAVSGRGSGGFNAGVGFQF